MSSRGSADPVIGAEQRGPATVVIAQRMKHGRGGDVRHWPDDVNRVVGQFTGYLGNDVAGPPTRTNGP